MISHELKCLLADKTVKINYGSHLIKVITFEYLERLFTNVLLTPLVSCSVASNSEVPWDAALGFPPSGALLTYLRGRHITSS